MIYPITWSVNSDHLVKEVLLRFLYYQITVFPFVIINWWETYFETTVPILSLLVLSSATFGIHC